MLVILIWWHVNLIWITLFYFFYNTICYVYCIVYLLYTEYYVLWKIVVSFLLLRQTFVWPFYSILIFLYFLFHFIRLFSLFHNVMNASINAFHIKTKTVYAIAFSHGIANVDINIRYNNKASHSNGFSFQQLVLTESIFHGYWT